MKQINSGIYKIINKTNGKLYIGSSINLYNRRHRHFHCLKHGKHVNRYLQNEFKKYGENNFTFIILEYCKPQKLLTTEQKYLDEHFDNQNNCYNIIPNAKNSFGYQHTEETKIKMSKKRLGIKLSKQTRDRMSQSRKGKPVHSEKRKKDLSERFKGEKNPGYGKYGSRSRTAKKVFQYDLNGKLIKKYGSIIEASKELKICKTSISSCCNGSLKKAGKYMWSFKLLHM